MAPSHRAYIPIVYTEVERTRARVFRSGNSQAIRLPREFRLSTDEVEITRQGELLVLRPLPSNGGALFDALAAIDIDWPEREDGPPEERDRL